MSQTISTCPTCDSHEVVPIEYGYPGGDMMLDELAGKIVLGGCEVTDHDPQWVCRACDTRF